MSTDKIKSVDVATETVAGIRSSFNMCLDKLGDSFEIKGLEDLGLAIGYEIGDVSLIRIGKRSNTSRYALGVSTIESENAQKVCKGNATKIGENAYNYLSDKYKGLFKDQVGADLTYDKVKTADEADSEKNKSKKSSLYDSVSQTTIGLKAHAQSK